MGLWILGRKPLADGVEVPGLELLAESELGEHRHHAPARLGNGRPLHEQTLGDQATGAGGGVHARRLPDEVCLGLLGQREKGLRGHAARRRHEELRHEVVVAEELVHPGEEEPDPAGSRVSRREEVRVEVHHRELGHHPEDQRLHLGGAPRHVRAHLGVGRHTGLAKSNSFLPQQSTSCKDEGLTKFADFEDTTRHGYELKKK
mmetsp:Transcript_50869/g.115538  ORF Transcript_50869/g.115538 Transcript_50869/m.115538 type:complete len:203 (-) Transcript_50869:6-614(-)